MATITLHSGDTENIHIDTYQMLTGESWQESEIDCLRESLKNSELTYDDFDWDYNHDAIVKDFTMVSINYLHHELITHGDGLVKAITYKEHGSPKYYNYSSDWYIAEYDVDTVKLHEYIAANYDAVREKALTYDRDDVSKENLAHAGLCHYIDATISSDDYNYALWESEWEVYGENTTITLAKHD